jgi:hypothetical protein
VRVQTEGSVGVGSEGRPISGETARLGGVVRVRMRMRVAGEGSEGEKNENESKLLWHRGQQKTR